jgi:hypothetical protein
MGQASLDRVREIYAVERVNAAMIGYYGNRGTMSGRHFILITDGDTVHEWQRRALATLPADDRITVFACTNTTAETPIRQAFPLLCAELSRRCAIR